MKVIAKANYLRIAPRKVRLVADLIRKKGVKEAKNMLSFLPNKSARPLKKLLDSALAGAKNNFHLDPDNFYIEKITVDEGPKYKRWEPRARGSVSEIQKKTSHITVVLEEIKKTSQKIKKIKRGAKDKPVGEAKKVAGTEPEKKEFIPEKQKPKRPLQPPAEKPKPKIAGGLRRIFRRKSF